MEINGWKYTFFAVGQRDEKLGGISCNVSEFLINT